MALSACASRGPAPQPVSPVPAVPQSASPLTQSFLQATASAHLFELQTAEMALQMSRDPGVRAYAQSLHNDHSHLLSRTSAVAESARASPAPMLQPHHFSLLQQLQTAGPTHFDETFRNIQVMAHMQSIDVHQRYTATGDNPAVRAFASEVLPFLHAHLAAAQSLRIVSPPRYRPRPRPGERG